MQFRTIREFVRLEASARIVLFVAVVLALIVDNTPLMNIYQNVIEYKLGFSIG